MPFFFARTTIPLGVAFPPTPYFLQCRRRTSATSGFLSGGLLRNALPHGSSTGGRYMGYPGPLSVCQLEMLHDVTADWPLHLSSSSCLPDYHNSGRLLRASSA